MPVVRDLARHDDLGEFTHGKLDVSSDEFDKVRNEASLGVKSNSDTFTVLYRGLLLQYEKKGLHCQTCGKKRLFVPNPVFFVTTDPEYATHECTLRSTVYARCLHCIFSNFTAQACKRVRVL